MLGYLLMPSCMQSAQGARVIPRGEDGNGACADRPARHDAVVHELMSLRLLIWFSCCQARESYDAAAEVADRAMQEAIVKGRCTSNRVCKPNA